MLPVAPGAYGHPPIPPSEASKLTTPACSAAMTLARPMPRVLWKCSVSGTVGWALPHAVTTSCTWAGCAMPVVSARVMLSMPMATYCAAAQTTRESG